MDVVDGTHVVPGWGATMASEARLDHRWRRVPRRVGVAAACFMFVALGNVGAAPSEMAVGEAHTIVFTRWGGPAGESCGERARPVCRDAILSDHDYAELNARSRAVSHGARTFVWIEGDVTVASSPTGENTVDAFLDVFADLKGTVVATGLGSSDFTLAVEVADAQGGGSVLSQELASASVQGGYRQVKAVPLPSPDADLVDADIVEVIPLQVERGRTYRVTITMSVSTRQAPEAGAHASINMADDLPGSAQGRGVRVRRARIVIGDDLAERVQLVHDDVEAVVDAVDGFDDKLDALIDGQRSAKAHRQESTLATCSKLTSAFLPEAHGGELEELEALVEDRIATYDSLGWEAEQARRFLERARAHRSDGDYLKAFGTLCTSYKHLVSSPPRR